MKKFIHLLVTILMPAMLFAQVEKVQSGIDTLALLFNQLHGAASEEAKMRVNDEVLNVFNKVLPIPESFDMPFDTIQKMGKVPSPDKELNIYSWNLALPGAKYKYYAMLQFKNKRKENCQVVQLSDRKDPGEKFLWEEIGVNDWYGALYYEIIPVKIDGNVHYTLLGLDFNDMLTSKKLVDIMNVTDEGEISFGKPVFEKDGKKLHRLVFEYSARASMSMKYIKEKDMIVYDHLSPSKPSYKGNYQFYGPDFSYDALEFKKGTWHTLEDVYITN